MLKYSQTLHLTGRLLQHRILPYHQCRRFAFSRFPEPKAPGSFRSTRRRPESRPESNPQAGEPAHETHTPEDDSQLWHTSQRPPASNPEEGLRRLLAENETLVIERCALCKAFRSNQRISDIGAGKSRCLTSLLVLSSRTNTASVRELEDRQLRYVLTLRRIGNEHGVPLGYIAEEPGGFLKTFSRQLLSTHRPFRALVMDLEGSPILWVRPLLGIPRFCL